MHIMDRTPKIITIIGLVFEGFAVLVLGLFGLMFKIMVNYDEFRESLMTDMTGEEADSFIFFMGILTNFFIIFALILLIFFIVNLFLFVKLMKGYFTKEQAKKVYLYQAIWGGINLLSNQITGILYLISGIQGYNERRETTDIREGI